MPATITVPTTFTVVDKVSPALVKMARRAKETAEAFQNKWGGVQQAAKNVAIKTAVAGTAMAAPLVFAVKKAMDFEEKMADVAKTTGLSGNALKAYGDSILNYSSSTGTHIDALAEIGAIGGSLGIASNQLASFTKAADSFNIALGSDFGGVDTAVRSVSALQNLFKETRGLDAASSINKVGSAINELTSVGANAMEMANFTNRIGALPDAIKPSIQNTIALSAVFNKSGISAEVAASGFQNLMSIAGKNLPLFAKQMKISYSEAAKLFNSDPTKFAMKFSKSFEGMSGLQISEKLGFLGINSSEVKKVVGSLGASSDNLAKYQAKVNEQFLVGNSLSAEAAKKNDTLAQKINMALNSFVSFAIVVGTELLPPLTKFISKVVKVASSIVAWAQENKPLVKWLLRIAGAIIGVVYAVSAISTVIGTLIEIKKGWVAVQKILNIAMKDNPIGLIIVGIVALIAIVVLVIEKWDEWGAAFSLIMGPLGIVISLIQSFRRNWDMITKAFKEGGIIAGLKAIGKVILDALLQPFEQLLGIIAKFTGFKWAENAAAGLNQFRAEMGVNMEGNSALGTPQQKADELRSQNPQQNRLSIDINDPNKRVGKTQMSGPLKIPVTTTPTWGVK